MTPRLVAMIALAACSSSTEGHDSLPAPSLGDRHVTRGAPPTTSPALARPDVVRAHMALHFDDLREVEHLLVRGQLDAARARAFMLTIPATDPGLARWQADQAAIAALAREIVAATSLDDAAHLEISVARGCADCHARTAARMIFASPPALPALDGSATAVMRHAWAADRLWEGLVANDATSWRAGWEILAEPWPRSLSPSPFADQLQILARRELAGPDEPDATTRALAYERAVDTCLACHADHVVAPGTGGGADRQRAPTRRSIASIVSGASSRSAHR